MKTKHIFYSLLLTAATAGNYSCSKSIDLSPTHAVFGDEYFTKVEDYEQALTGAYTRLLADGYYGTSNIGANAFVGLTDYLSDNFYESVESLGNQQDFYRWTYTADDPSISDLWLDGYRVVQQANLVLRGIDKLAASSPGAVNRIRAQAIALRAMAHFDLLRYFGEGTDRQSAAKGIPYVEVFDVEQKPARLTVKQTYDKIEADFKLAKSLMTGMDKSIQSAGTGGGDRSYIDDMVVNGLLARMYHYAGSADSTVKYATLCINARPLASRTVFPNIWIDASTSEVIWSVKFEGFNSSIGSTIYDPATNRSTFRPSTSLLTLYDQVNDVRYSSYFRTVARGSGSRVVMVKYNSKQASINRPDGIVNFKALRTGEMYLARAEAYARMGGAFEAQALDDLNTLRAARINGYVPVVLSGTALQTAILTERRKELVAEGQRFFDLKRTTKTVSRVTNCNSFCNLPSTAREWAFPIPQDEILANPAVQQNTGY